MFGAWTRMEAHADTVNHFLPSIPAPYSLGENDAVPMKQATVIGRNFEGKGSIRPSLIHFLSVIGNPSGRRVI
jgi:hypothetical protein